MSESLPSILHTGHVYYGLWAQIAVLSASVNDPKTPFQTLYEARELLVAALEERKTQRVKRKSTAGGAVELEAQDDAELVALLELQLGLNFSQTEEFGNAEKKLSAAAGALGKKPVQYALELISANNALGYIWSKREQYEKGLRCLVRAKLAYLGGRHVFLALHPAEEGHEHVQASVVGEEKEEQEFLPEPELVEVQEDVHDEQAMALYQSSTQWGAAEAAHTLSLFYMAQMYGRIHKVDLMQKYVLVTLERQLQLNQEYERLQWATNASNLSIFYSDRGFFPQAYLCLKAAEHMLPSSVFPIPLQPDQDNASAEQRLAVDVLRAWGKFYLSYLQHSGSAYAQVVEEGDPGAVMEALHSRMGEFKARNCSQPLPNFASLSLEAPPALSMLVDFKAASEAFKQGLKAFDGAKRFYQLDGFVTDHIMIVQNISALYMHLVLFEPDLGRRCKMHKRRINLLEPFLDSVNPKVYSEFYQQVSHEVARCYSHMGDLKRAMNEKRAKNSEGYAAAVLKANELTLKAVQYFQIWQNTFVSEDEDDPDMIGEDYYEVYLNSLFHTARLFTKIVHASPQTVNMFLQKAVDFYKRIVMLAEKWELQADVFADELRMSKEMIELLPMKIDVLARTNSSTL